MRVNIYVKESCQNQQLGYILKKDVCKGKLKIATLKTKEHKSCDYICMAVLFQVLIQ